jgi:hypothetical protein
MGGRRAQWYMDRRRQAEWARLPAETKRVILEALNGAPGRPTASQMEMRIRGRPM